MPAVNKLIAPFPYFGGKSSISDVVWAALGNPKHFIEPFFGSGAVLLAREGYDPTMHVETVNDKDGFICNVWRSLQFSPDETARWCDWPVNHADLMARKSTLIKNEKRLIENLAKDDRCHDPIMAGYWIWAASCWIGSGLTSPNQRPDIGRAGMGVHKLSKRPHLRDAGMGVHKLSKRPHLRDAGMGVQEPYNLNIYTWFRELSERLRDVRVVCGDWTRVCGGNWQDNLGDVGIFFDPPYGVKDRADVYHHESRDVAKDVLDWSLERGKIKSYRIVIAGYEEHSELLDNGWSDHQWKAGGGYANIGGKENTNKNKNSKRETLYFSPHCHKLTLFD